MPRPDVTPRPVHRGDATQTTRINVGRQIPGVSAYEESALRCAGTKKDGGPCAGFSSGGDGLCAGHRRQRIARS